MDQISLNCSKCKQPLKFPVGRAGSKAKCTRCGTELTVPSITADPAPPSNSEEEDDGPMTYGIVEVAPEKRKAPDEKKKADKPKSAIEKRKKTIKHAASWAKMRPGLLFMSTGTMIWLGGYVVYLLLLLLGATQGPEYNNLRLKFMLPENGEPELAKFAVGLIAGEDWAMLGWWVHILLSITTLVQIAVFTMGYFTCLAVPERFGAKGQVKWLITLAMINATIVIVFRLLAFLGISYVILPYLIPETPTLEANIERIVPINLTWSTIQFLDAFLTLIFICIQWAECTLGAVFIRTIGLSIRDDELKDSGSGLVHLAMGAAFIQICFHLVSLNGASDVLVSVMRLVYFLIILFQTLFIVYYMKLLQRTYATLGGLLENWEPGDEEEDDDDEDEDDDEEDDDEPRSKKKKKKKRRDKEDDDEEDDDDDDDDEEERKPRKGKKR